MKKILIGIGLVIILILWETGHLAYALYAQKHGQEVEALQLAKQYTGIVTIDKTFVYNGKESYLVVEGKTKQNIPVIAWFKDNKLAKIVYRSDITGEDKILADVQKKEPGAKIIHIMPGIENNIEVWEVAFHDKDGKLAYTYYNMKTGSFIRTYRLQKLEK